MKQACFPRALMTLRRVSVALVMSALITATAFAQTGTPRLDPQDPHRFVMNGQPWLLTGYTPSLGALSLRRDNVNLSQYYSDYHSWLQSRGMTSYRAVFSFGQAFQGAKTDETLPYLKVAGQPKYDLDLFNPQHFQYWRSLIQDAGAKGLVVQLVILESWHLNQVDHGDGWGRMFDFYYGPNNVNNVTFNLNSEAEWHSATRSSVVYQRQKLLVDKVVAELGDLPNIIWEICNEPNQFYDSWAKPLAQHLKVQDLNRHLVMPIDLPDHQHTPGQKPPEHLPDTAHDSLVLRFSSGEALIAHNDNSNAFLGAGGQRKKGWGVLTAGAHIDYFFGSPLRSDFGLGTTADAGARYLGFLRQFTNLLGVNLSGMEPNDVLVQAPVSEGAWCLARPGEEYVVYKRDLAANTSVTVFGLPLNYQARWFNPRSGSAAYPVGVGFPAGGGIRFTPPDSAARDWVLHILQQGPATTTIQVAPYADAQMQQAQRLTNFGSSVTLSVRGTDTGQGKYSLLRFSVPPLSGPVVSAKLKIRTRFLAIPQVDLYRVDNTSWGESWVNWDNWDVNGSTLIPAGSVSGLLGDSWHLIDVSAGVNGNGTTDLGLVTAVGNDVDGQDFWSRSSGNSPFLEVTPGSGPVKIFTPVADAWFGEEAPFANHGSGAELRVRSSESGHVTYSLLRFAVSGISGGVQSAVLHLRTQETFIGQVSVLRAGNIQWSEGGVNFENWNQNGLTLTFLGNEGPLAAGTFYELDVTSGVTGGGDLVLGIANAQDADGHFWSRESSFPPELIIEYQP